MRSPDRARRVTVALLLLATVLFAGLGAWSLVARSTVGVVLDGTVTAIETRAEKHPGVDDVWIVVVDGTEHHLDAELAQSLDVGDRLAKGRWDTRLTVNGEPRTVHLGDDARAMLILAPGVVLAAVALPLPGRRRVRERPVTARRG